MASTKRTPFHALARKYGYELKRQTNHLIWRHCITGRLVVTPKSTSDWRAAKNAERTFRSGALAAA